MSGTPIFDAIVKEFEERGISYDKLTRPFLARVETPKKSLPKRVPFMYYPKTENSFDAFSRRTDGGVPVQIGKAVQEVVQMIRNKVPAVGIVSGAAREMSAIGRLPDFGLSTEIEEQGKEEEYLDDRFVMPSGTTVATVAERADNTPSVYEE